MGWASAPMLQQLPVLAQRAQWLCAAYLLWLAWRLARSPVAAPTPIAAHNAAATSAPSPWQALGQGAAVQGLNPKAWLFALSAIGIFVAPQGAAAPASLGLLCAISLLACLLGVGCWALLGRALVRWLRTPQRQQCLHRLLAALLVASVLGMLA